jgi:hypothetical protein
MTETVKRGRGKEEAASLDAHGLRDATPNKAAPHGIGGAIDGAGSRRAS